MKMVGILENSGQKRGTSLHPIGKMCPFSSNSEKDRVRELAVEINLSLCRVLPSMQQKFRKVIRQQTHFGQKRPPL
jgi:hypothetical protein